MKTYDYKGAPKTVAQLTKLAKGNIGNKLIRSRLAKGWTAERAITELPLDYATAAVRGGKARARQMRARGESPVTIEKKS